MAEFKVEEEYAAKAAVIWEKIADFGGIDGWMPGVESCKATGQGVGAERRIAMGPIKIVERLEKLDPATRTLAYSIVEGPLPVQNYLATMTVSETGAESCHVDWSATFDLPDGLGEEQIVPAVQRGYQGALKGLKALIEG